MSLMRQALEAALVTGAFAALALCLGMVGVGGAVGGFVLGVAIYASLGIRGFAILALFVVGGSLLTRLGYARKKRAGTAQEHGGRRGAKNALANCGVAVACALLAAYTSADVFADVFAAAFVAALGAAFADTAESEIGQLYGRTPRLVTNLRKVPPGTDGAVSVAGTLAGVLAAAITAVAGHALGLVGTPSDAMLVALAAFLGTVADSLLGALAPRIGNEVTNVLCTAVAAAMCLFLLA